MKELSISHRVALVAAFALTLSACGSEGEAPESPPADGPTANSQTSPTAGSESSPSESTTDDNRYVPAGDPAAWFAENCSAQVKTLDDKDDVILVRGAIKPPLDDTDSKGIEGSSPFRLFIYDELNNVMTPYKVVGAEDTFCLDGEPHQLSAPNPADGGKEGWFSQVRGPELPENTYIDDTAPKGLALESPNWETIGSVIPSALWSVDLAATPLEQALSEPVGSEPDYCDYTFGLCGG